MKRSMITLTLALGVLAATGCSGPAHPTGVEASLAATARLDATESSPDAIVFGAGDALGREFYIQYVAQLRLTDTEPVYAGVDTSPGHSD